MERWVAIILGMLVIVVGFVIINQIMDGQEELGNTGSIAECKVNGGSCEESCDADAYDEIQCPEGFVCCPIGG